MIDDAYSYRRWSTLPQGAGDTERRQETSAAAYCALHGLRLDHAIVDRGVSGFTGANRDKGALRSFLRAVEDGRIKVGSYLLIDSMDRLSRLPVVEAAHQLLGIALAGVRVVTLNDGRIFDRSAQLPEVILAVAEIERSHRESAEKGRKVKEAHGQSKRRAREEGRVWSKSGPPWLRLNLETRQFEPIAERVAVVQRVFNWRHEGLGSTVIAKRLNREGVPTFLHGKLWHDTTVTKMLRSRAILGEYQPRFRDNSPDGEPVPGYYGAAVVEAALFHAVQAQMDKQRGVRSPRTGKMVRNLFSGIARCGRCGGPMCVQRRSKDQRDLFLCYAMDQGACDNRRRHRVAEFEAWVLDSIASLDLAERQPASTLSEDLARALGERDDARRRAERLLAMIEDGDTLAQDRYRARRQDAQAADALVARLQAALEAETRAPSPSDHQADVARLRGALEVADEDGRFALRSRLAEAMRTAIDRVTMHDDGSIIVVAKSAFAATAAEVEYLVQPDQGWVWGVALGTPGPGVDAPAAPAWVH